MMPRYYRVTRSRPVTPVTSHIPPCQGEEIARAALRDRTPSGWRYTKPIGGLTPKELQILNPPTNTQDGGFFGGIPGLLGSGSF